MARRKLTVTQTLMAARLAKAKQMRLNGKTNAEIAKAVGWSAQTVRRHLGKQPKAIVCMSNKKAAIRRALKREEAMLIKNAPRYIQCIYDTQNQTFSPALNRINFKLDHLLPPDDKGDGKKK
jgi:predicted transcriptional regulator